MLIVPLVTCQPLVTNFLVQPHSGENDIKCARLQVVSAVAFSVLAHALLYQMCNTHMTVHMT